MVKLNKKRVLVAPLNWGLGHATRSIPIIKALISADFEPIIASDGAALMLLQKEFPELKCLELRTYNVTYSKEGKHFKLKLLKGSPKLLKAIKKENKFTQEIIERYKISAVISDNRLGVRSKKVPSVIVTHQLNVLSGNTTWLSTMMHEQFIRKFDVCWVPDYKEENNLSGKLGHPKSFVIDTKYIGALSRFEKQKLPIKNDLLVLLSGPEPQRTLLEEKLLRELQNFTGKVCFVKGKMEKKQIIEDLGNLRIYNFMTSKDLEKTINESALVISRSGYTTVMDLAQLGKKAFFIPTPGQFEQEYLAKRLTHLGLVPSCSQEKFTLEKLNYIQHFEGFNYTNGQPNLKDLFRLF